MPDALPATSPQPPPTGIYGLPLKPYGDELHEDLPDGGYISWKIEKRKDGNLIWMPQDYNPADKRIKA